MADFEDHEGNGTAVEGFYAEDNGGPGGEIEDHIDSKSKVPLLFDYVQIFQILISQICVFLASIRDWIQFEIEFLV